MSADGWALYAADEGLREDAYVVFETLCITVLDRHPLDGAWLFLTTYKYVILLYSLSGVL